MRRFRFFIENFPMVWGNTYNISIIPSLLLSFNTSSVCFLVRIRIFILTREISFGIRINKNKHYEQ